MLRDYRTDIQTLGDLGNFKKTFRRIGAVLGGAVSGITFGLLKPKVFKIKNPKSLKYFKVGKIVGIAGTVVTGAFLAGPSIAGFMRTAGSKVFGVLTKGFMAKGMTQAAAGLAAQKVMQGAAPVPPEVATQIEQMALQYDQTAGATLGSQTGPLGYGVGPQYQTYGTPSQAGMFGFGGGEIPWGTIMIGVITVGTIMFITGGISRPRYSKGRKIYRNPGMRWHLQQEKIAKVRGKEQLSGSFSKGYYTGEAQAHFYSAAESQKINRRRK